MEKKPGASRKKPRWVVFGAPHLVFTSSARTTASEPVKGKVVPVKDDVMSSLADPEVVHIESAYRVAVDPVVEIPIVVTRAEGSGYFAPPDSVTAPRNKDPLDSCEGTRSLEEKFVSLEVELADLKR
ncbi:unnamed protein product [Urochloa humidicola]